MTSPNGSIATCASGRKGDVAAWSKYTYSGLGADDVDIASQATDAPTDEPPWWTIEMSASDNPYGIPGYNAATYGEAFADVYDDWYADLNDKDFIASIAAALPARTAHILELGVGTGRLIRQLRTLRPDYDDTIIGVDSSEAMLAIARSSDLGSTTTLLNMDFSQSLPDGPFDAVFVGYNTFFNLPTTEAMQQCMSLVASRLGQGASFHIDVVNPQRSDESDHMRIRTMTTGEVVLSISRHDEQAQRIIGQFVQFTNGQQTRLRPYSVRYVNPQQLDHLAQSAGLQLVSRHADGNETPIASDSDRHVSRYTRAD
jgi:trans-aconitate methyltransferase